MRTHRILGLLAALVLAGLPAAVLSASPASAGSLVPTDLSGDRQYKRGMYADDLARAHTPAADTVGYAGRLTYLDGGEAVGLVGVTVTLERKLASETSWTALDEGVTIDSDDAAQDGLAVFFTPVVASGKYRVTFAGDETYGPSATEAMRLTAMRDLNGAKRERNGRVFLAGDVNPGWGGKVVTWEKKACKTCTWRTVAQDRATRTGGWQFRAAYPPRLRTNWFWRARLEARGDFADSVSVQLRTYRVAQRVAARTLS